MRELSDSSIFDQAEALLVFVGKGRTVKAWFQSKDFTPEDKARILTATVDMEAESA